MSVCSPVKALATSLAERSWSCLCHGPAFTRLNALMTTRFTRLAFVGATAMSEATVAFARAAPALVGEWSRSTSQHFLAAFQSDARRDLRRRRIPRSLLRPVQTGPEPGGGKLGQDHAGAYLHAGWRSDQTACLARRR